MRSDTLTREVAGNQELSEYVLLLTSQGCKYFQEPTKFEMFLRVKIEFFHRVQCKTGM